MLACAATLAATPDDQTDRLDVDIRDEGLFPPELFPNLPRRSFDEIVLAGLQALYPERIVAEPPLPLRGEARPPMTRELNGNAVYVRVRDPALAMDAIREALAARPAVVIDLRYVVADLEETLALGAMLTRRPTFSLRVVGDFAVPDGATVKDGIVTVQGERRRGAEQAVFALSNHATSGPIEALLDQLRDDDEILSVGTVTAGQTASYRPMPGVETLHIISGEIRALGDRSLVGVGFRPRILVEVTPEDDLLAYSALTEDMPIEQVAQVRAARPGREDRLLEGAPSEPDALRAAIAEPAPLDIVLHRAINILRALQALGQISS